MRYNFRNIDKIERLKRKRIALVRQSLKKVTIIVGLTATLAVAGTAINKNNQNEVDRQQVAMEQQGLTKVYKSVTFQKGDTLTSVVNKIMEEYPDTANFYTTESMIKEVAKINNLGNVNNIETGNAVIIPYYAPIEVINEIDENREADKEKAEALDDYEDYVVQNGDTYWKLAYKYTDDDNEAARLVDIIKRLNDNENLRMDSTIKIPNIEKYKLLHAEYDVESVKTM